MAARSTIIGSFVLGAFAVGVAAVLFFSSMAYFSHGPRAVAFFDGSVAGLDIGAPVTFRGVRVGSVVRIGIRVSTESLAVHIPVIVQFEGGPVTWEGGRLAGNAADLQRLIHAGLRAQLVQQSLVTGQLGVDLELWPNTPVRLVNVDVGLPEIPTIPSELDQLRSTLANLPLRSLVDTSQKTLAAVQALSTHVNSRLDPLVDSLERTANTATATLQTVNAATRDVQTQASTTLHDIDTLVRDAHVQLNVRGAELGRTLSTADQTAEQVRLLISSLNDLIGPNSDISSNLEAASRDLAASTSSLRDFSETVDRHPNVLLLGRSEH